MPPADNPSAIEAWGVQPVQVAHFLLGRAVGLAIHKQFWLVHSYSDDSRTLVAGTYVLREGLNCQGWLRLWCSSVVGGAHGSNSVAMHVSKFVGNAI